MSDEPRDQEEAPEASPEESAEHQEQFVGDSPDAPEQEGQGDFPPDAMNAGEGLDVGNSEDAFEGGGQPVGKDGPASPRPGEERVDEATWKYFPDDTGEQHEGRVSQAERDLAMRDFEDAQQNLSQTLADTLNTDVEGRAPDPRGSALSLIAEITAGGGVSGGNAEDAAEQLAQKTGMPPEAKERLDKAWAEQQAAFDRLSPQQQSEVRVAWEAESERFYGGDATEDS